MISARAAVFSMPPNAPAGRLWSNELAPDAARRPARRRNDGTSPIPQPTRALCPLEGGLWWTEGAPRVARRRFASAGLPDENTFSTMLVSCSSAPPALLPRIGSMIHAPVER